MDTDTTATSTENFHSASQNSDSDGDYITSLAQSAYDKVTSPRTFRSPVFYLPRTFRSPVFYLPISEFTFNKCKQLVDRKAREGETGSVFGLAAMISLCEMKEKAEINPKTVINADDIALQFAIEGDIDNLAEMKEHGHNFGVHCGYAACVNGDLKTLATYSCPKATYKADINILEYLYYNGLQIMDVP